VNGLDVVSYFDVGDRPGFKMALLRRGSRYLMYVGHLWHRGWSVVDITEPEDPRVLNFLEGPENTWTCQVDVSQDFLLTGLEHIPDGWGASEHQENEEGVIVWDLHDPHHPVPAGRYRTGSAGTHRNLIDAHGFAHLSAHSPGRAGRVYQVLDCRSARVPELVGSFELPEQLGSGHDTHGVSLHGPPVPLGDLVYLPYGRSGVVVVRRQMPGRSFEEVGRLGFSPPFLSHIGVHSVLPLRSRQLLLACSETTQEDCLDPLGHISLIDASRPDRLRLLSVLPAPRPGPEEGYANYCQKGGRFGPHNIYQQYHNYGAWQGEDLVFATYFNAGLRVYEITDPLLPREVGFFVPPDPSRRYGTQPKGKLVAQSEDVVVDDRGFIFVSHKNQGIWCLRRSHDGG
jgi:hypothetical protein